MTEKLFLQLTAVRDLTEETTAENFGGTSYETICTLKVSVSCTDVQTSESLSLASYSNFDEYFTHLSFDKLPDIPMSSAAFS